MQTSPDDRTCPDTLPDNPTTLELLHFAVGLSQEALRLSRESLAVAKETRGAVTTLANNHVSMQAEIVKIRGTLSDVQSDLTDAVRFDRDTMATIARVPMRAPAGASWGPPKTAITKVRAWAALGVLAAIGAGGVALADWLAGR